MPTIEPFKLSKIMKKNMKKWCEGTLFCAYSSGFFFDSIQKLQNLIKFRENIFRFMPTIETSVLSKNIFHSRLLQESNLTKKLKQKNTDFPQFLTCLVPTIERFWKKVQNILKKNSFFETCDTFFLTTLASFLKTQKRRNVAIFFKFTSKSYYNFQNVWRFLYAYKSDLLEDPKNDEM